MPWTWEEDYDDAWHELPEYDDDDEDDDENTNQLSCEDVMSVAAWVMHATGPDLESIWDDSVSIAPWLMPPPNSNPNREDLIRVLEQFPSVYNSMGRFQPLSLTDWANMPCGNSLPPNWKWYGTYVVCKDFRGYRSATTTEIIAEQTFSCPHCAKLWLDTNMPNSGAHLLAMGSHAIEQHRRLFPEVVGQPVFQNLVGSSVCQKHAEVAPCCSNCGFPGHNKASCDSPRVYDKIGIEIEGRWIDLNAVMVRADSEGLGRSSDGSIERSFESAAQAYELKTKPGAISAACRQLVDFYPDEADASCGMHVHTSFMCNTYITQLMTKKFFEFFTARMTAWGTQNRLHPDGQFFRRLRGNNSFCRPNEEITNPYVDDRYRQLNFTSWGSHKTLECRLAPMFKNAQLGVSYVVELLSIYRDFLLGENGDEVSWPAVKAEVENVQFVHNEAESVEFVDLVQNTTKVVVTIPELPPLEPGHRRIALTSDKVTNLQQIIRMAA